MRKIFLLALIVFLGAASFNISAQTPEAGAKAALTAGEVVAINQGDNKISLKTNDGMMDVILSASTVYKKIPPDNPKMSAAVDAALSDLGVGDKVIVSGFVAPDKKSVPARNIYLMTKADISKKTAAEQSLWKTRGITGRVVSLNPNKEEFTIAVRGMMGGEQNVVVSGKDGVNYRRYAAGSVKFDDAKPSSFAEVKIGDQIRALGDKSADNTTFSAEQIISGAFKMVAGTITAIDVAKNEITVKELQGNKLVTVAVNSNTMMRNFPVERATMMAAMMNGGGMGGVQPPQGGGNGNVVINRPQSGGQPGGAQPGGAQPGNGQGGGRQMVFSGPGGPRGGRGADVDDLLQTLPTISITDLKVGDSIGVSSAANEDATRYTAIKLVSGVEPFFRAPQVNMGGGRGNNQPQINIPGLDGGFGAP